MLVIILKLMMKFIMIMVLTAILINKDYFEHSWWAHTVLSFTVLSFTSDEDDSTKG